MSFLLCKLNAPDTMPSCNSCSLVCVHVCTHSHGAHTLQTYLSATHLCTLSKHDLLHCAELCSASAHFNQICTFSHTGTKSVEVRSLPDNPLTSWTAWNLDEGSFCILSGKGWEGRKTGLLLSICTLWAKNKFQKGTARRQISQRYGDKGAVQI